MREYTEVIKSESAWIYTHTVYKPTKCTYHIHRGPTECCCHHVVLKVSGKAKVRCREEKVTEGWKGVGDKGQMNESENEAKCSPIFIETTCADPEDNHKLIKFEEIEKNCRW